MSTNPIVEADHAKMVSALKKPGKQICEELSFTEAEILHMAVGIATEAGELLDQAKRHTIYQKQLDVENVIEELGDLEFYMEGMRQLCGISREETLIHNMRKLATRYSGTYTNDKAIQRKDKVDEQATN